MHTELLRHQHKEIMGIVNDMRRNLLAPQRMTLPVAEALQANLEALASRIMAHLTIEDKGVYPKLLASSAANAASTARKFSEEMDVMRASFREFRMHWTSGTAIHTEPIRFVDECTTIFHLISHRIEHEEKELYPLVDALP